MAYLIRRRTAHIAVGLADLASWTRRASEQTDGPGRRIGR